MTAWTARLCSEIAPAAVNWLWPGYLARGKLSLLDGDPAMGKSLLTLDLMARLTRGAALPDGSPSPGPTTCAILSAEDDYADTIRPRAEAAGADLSRLVIPDLGGRPARFPNDLPALEELIVERGVELLVIDPLMAFLPPGVAANLDQCVRQALTPLASLAAWTGCAMKFVRHLTKQPADRALLRGQGSMGIVAAVRTALYVAPHPAVLKVAGSVREPSPTSPARVLALSKTNLGPPSTALGYRVVESASGLPVVEWTGPADVTADGLCGGPTEERLHARDRAVDWLRRELAGGPRKVAELYAAAAETGIPERTLERAKQELRAKSHREWNDKQERGEWWWYDPDAAWPKKAPFQKPMEWPPLPPLPGF